MRHCEWRIEMGQLLGVGCGSLIALVLVGALLLN